MQTFLPYKNFKKTAKCLDFRRLGKQRVEAWQIYKALTEENYGWKNHPIVKMWRGYEIQLLQYGIEICEEWKKRGYKDSMLSKFRLEYHKCLYFILIGRTTFLWHKIFNIPFWLGNKDFHASHRSNLLRKNKEYYSKFNWKEPNNLPYKWII